MEIHPFACLIKYDLYYSRFFRKRQGKLQAAKALFCGLGEKNNMLNPGTQKTADSPPPLPGIMENTIFPC